MKSHNEPKEAEKPAEVKDPMRSFNEPEGSKVRAPEAPKAEAPKHPHPQDEEHSRKRK